MSAGKRLVRFWIRELTVSHWWCCCPDIEVPPGPCTCEYSSDGNAPCCFKVSVSNMTDGDNCQSCSSELNRSYYLVQTEAGSCIWNCRHLCLRLSGAYCQDSGSEWEITLTVSDEGADQYKITVDLGPHKWAKTYDSKPSLSDIYDTLTWISDSGSCNSSSATCIIAATEYSAGKDCLCACTVRCPECEDELVTSIVEVTISGVVNTGLCTDCPTINGTYTLRFVSCSTHIICCDRDVYAIGRGPYWSYSKSTGWPCPPGSCNYFGLAVVFRLARDTNTGTWYASVNVGPAGSTECVSSGECYDNSTVAWFTKTLALEGKDTDCRTFTFSDFSPCSADDSCDVSEAEVTVTVL
jgi:hypothetical protein